MDPRTLLPWKRPARRPTGPEATAPARASSVAAAPRRAQRTTGPDPEAEALGAENEAKMAAVLSLLSGEADDPDGAGALPSDRAKNLTAKPDLRVVRDDDDAGEAPEDEARPAPRASGAPRHATDEGTDAASAAATAEDKPAAGMAEPHSVAARPARPRLALPKLQPPEFHLPKVQFDLTGWRPLAPFLFATLGPVPFLLLAGLLGGLWSLLALLSMTAVHLCLDEILRHPRFERAPEKNPEPGTILRAQRLSVYLATLHFVLLAFAVWALSGAAGLGFLGWIATFLAFGLWFGQVSNSNAHELIHRSERGPFRAGMWVYISLLFGHHTSAHRLVHHRFVATTDDPNTAAEGENFYQFAVRAWPGAFVAGYEMERNLREGREAGGLADLNPYWHYLAGGAAFVVGVGLLFGLDGLLAYLLLAAYAQVQLLLSDYVQHYGLLRRELPSGVLEPASLQHSWDAPHPVSGFMMLNAARHSDHHAHPSRAYPALRLSPPGRAPLLPYSLPVMATIALVPSLWHRLMDRRVAALRTGRAA